MNAVGGQEVNVRVIQKRDAVQVDHLEVRSMGFDLADIDHLVDVFLGLRGELESA